METFGVYLLLAFLQLTVAQRLPEITYISQEQIKDIGSTVDLQCSVQNAQDFPVLWISVAENPLPISTGTALVVRDSRFSIRYDTVSSTYTLQIKDIQETDAAFYQCQILISLNNRVTAEVELQVRRQPVISDNSTRSLVTSEGQSVQLQCYASGQPHPRISWRRENNVILPTGGSIYRGNTLKISSIRKEDRGTYYCVAENGVGKGARRNIAVEVEFAPVISVPRPRLGQALQYDMDLECHVEAYPPPAIIWLRNDIQLSNNQHYSISHFATVDEFTDTTIRVITIEKRQYGQYVCRAANKLGTSEAAIELFETIDPICPPACGVALNSITETPLSLDETSESPLSLSTLPPTTAPTSTVSDSVAQHLPTITYISQEQIKDIGSTVDLQCSVENAQDFPVVWVKAAEIPYPISVGSSLVIPDSRFSIRYNNPSAHSATYTLQIEDVQEADAAFYRCGIMMSADQRISAEVQLQVRSPPVINRNSTRSILTSEGQSVQLQCYASGSPRPRISWRRENNAILPTGGVIYRGNTLEISSIQKEDRGIYYCVAENGVGRGGRLAITVEVEFVPVISAPRLRVGQALHYDADLECLVEAYPSPAIIWMKDEIQLHDNQHHTISQYFTADQFTDINLRLMTIEKQQYGLYVCRAVNKLGTSEATIELFETIDPICPPACGVAPNVTTETPLSFNETTETSLSPNETTETLETSSTLPPTTAPTSTVSDSVAQHLPKITYISQEQIKDIGSTVDLQCSVENAQDSLVVWVKATRNHYIISVGRLLLMRDSRLSIRYDNSPTSSGTYTLQIRNIQEADAAFYRCEVVTSTNKNISAAVELQVHSKPVISHNSTRSILTSEGRNIQLRCYASGYPRPRISWRRENNAILSTGGIMHRGDTLEISSIRKEDRGIYYCFAENGVGRGVRHAIAIHVEFAPVVSVPRLRVGQALRYDADLECLIEAYPLPEITWLSGEVELSNNRHYIISNFATADEVTNTNIRVITIEKQQYGQYNCRAVNKLGTSEARIELFETSTPICPPACSVVYNETNETLSSSSTPPSLSSSG